MRLRDLHQGVIPWRHSACISIAVPLEFWQGIARIQGDGLGTETAVFAFDFFGVLGSDMFDAWIEVNHLTGVKPFLRERFVDPADVGLHSFKDQCAGLGTIVGRPWQVVHEEFLQSSRIDHSVVELARELASASVVCVCSNAPAGLIEDLFTIHGISSPFRFMIVSGAVGLLKPSAEIYLYLARRAGVDPDRCLLIDDNEVNIAGASRVGMKGILFQSSEQLRQSLGVLGVL